MRKLAFVMSAEIEIDDNTFVNHLTDEEKVKIDVHRGNDALKIRSLIVTDVKEVKNEESNYS